MFIILGEIGIFLDPRLAMLDSPGSHAGAGMDQMIDIIPSIRYNTKPYILV
jgi:hypothetical protein